VIVHRGAWKPDWRQIPPVCAFLPPWPLLMLYVFGCLPPFGRRGPRSPNMSARQQPFQEQAQAGHSATARTDETVKPAAIDTHLQVADRPPWPSRQAIKPGKPANCSFHLLAAKSSPQRNGRNRQQHHRCVDHLCSHPQCSRSHRFSGRMQIAHDTNRTAASCDGLPALGMWW